MRGSRLLTPVAYLLAMSSSLATSSCHHRVDGGTPIPRPPTSWLQFRNNTSRDGVAYGETVLSDPNNVSKLHVVWTFPASGSGSPFRASPIVSDGHVYIGDGGGHFYCLDAATGNKIWQYPLQDQPSLTQQFGQCGTCNPSALGIAASAVITQIGKLSAVVFAAPDPSPNARGGPSSNPPYGDGHIIALDSNTGALIWESPRVALLDGINSGSGGSEHHEQTGYSSPLVLGNLVYIGISDHDDDPIQQGKVVAVKLSDGSIATGFTFLATPQPNGGGGVWGSLAGGKMISNDVIVTTGNSSGETDPNRKADPKNHGVSMLRLNGKTGGIVWKEQPVPPALDGDADWAAGPAIASQASCGASIVSTVKDGWTWAVKTDPDPSTPGHAQALWAFPPGRWSPGGFTVSDGTVHGNTDYKRPGAAWGDTYIGAMGGWQTQTTLEAGYHRLHALNICAADAQRVRWIKDIPGTTSYSQGPAGTYALGPPTVTPAGMVFVGTNQGHIVAIADPSLRPALGNRCEDPTFDSAQCTQQNRRLIPDPWIFDLALPGATSGPNTYGDGIAGEVVISDGAIYVATISGHLYKLQP